jgi:serine/threonine protein kinase
LAQDALHCAQCGAPVHSTAPSVEQVPGDLLLGRVFADKYRLVRRLSAGGFGAVYEALHTKLESRIAIKVLHAGLSQNPTIVERFRREALAASKIQNPNAVKVYDRGTTDDLLWIAMEFVDGETLEDRLQRSPLSEPELFELMGPICEVLFEAHQKKIIHRDLKPQNIMLVSVGTGRLIPKVLDFGIAALRDTGDSLTNSGAVSGTPKYMAPEQWEGSKHTDARSDIYALGVLSYRCLSGQLPFEADTPLSWMKQHCTQPPRDITLAMGGRPLSLSTRAAIMSALAKDPSERPQDAMAFFEALSGRAKPPEPKPSPEVAPASASISDDPTIAQPLVTASHPGRSDGRGVLVLPFFLVAGLAALGLIWLISPTEVSQEVPPTTTITLNTTAKTTSAPAPSPSSTNKKIRVESAPTTIPTTEPTQDPLAEECARLMKAKRLDEAQRLCGKSDDQEIKVALASLREELRARYIKQIEDALAANKPADSLLKKLTEISPNDPKIEELTRKNQESRKKNLWTRLQTETGDPGKFCRMTEQYLVLAGITADEERAAVKLLEKAGSSDVAECEALFKRFSL